MTSWFAKVVWQRLQQRCGPSCLKSHSDNDVANASQPFIRCYAKVQLAPLPAVCRFVISCMRSHFCNGFPLQNVNDGKLWLLKHAIVFEPRPVRVIQRGEIQSFKVNRSGTQL
jgi:hypothetical protein